jgi:hypothetical protein
MHECRQIEYQGVFTGRFVCKCGWSGSLEEAIVHCVVNQYEYKPKA